MAHSIRTVYLACSLMGIPATAISAIGPKKNPPTSQENRDKFLADATVAQKKAMASHKTIAQRLANAINVPATKAIKTSQLLIKNIIRNAQHSGV